MRVYLIQMGIRVACFTGAFFVGGGWLMWVMVAAAIVLPYTAVVFANAGRDQVHYDTSPMELLQLQAAAHAAQEVPVTRADTTAGSPALPAAGHGGTSTASEAAAPERVPGGEPTTDEAATEASGLICSGKGCPQTARWALLWNNPRIHTPERRKVWLSCDEHLDHLERFLNARSFLKETIPVDELATHPDADRAS